MSHYPTEAPYQPQDETVMTTGDWFVTQLLLAIPIANVVLLMVWALSSSGNHNRRNFSRATLIWLAIALGLLILTVIIGALAGR